MVVTTRPDQAPAGVRVVEVETAAEMAAACDTEAPNADIVGMAAAVADFRPADTADGKLKKRDGAPAVELVPTVDILAGRGAAKPDGQILIGFAAETDDLIGNAAEKLARKNLDAIVANDVSKPGVGFEHPPNEVVILLADGSRIDVPLTDKRDVARRVLDTAAGRLGQQ